MSDYQVSLDRLRLGLALLRLAKMEDNPIARTLHGKLIRAWDPLYGPQRNDRKFCTVRLAEHEVSTFTTLRIPSLLQCTYTAVYVDPEDPTVEVTVSTSTRPKTKATFNVRGGKRRLIRKSITRTKPNEMEHHMARKKNAPVDELEDLDDIDIDDDDDEDEAPAPKAKKPKTETAAEKRRRLKAEAAAAAADEDDEDDEDEDDEDEDDDEDEPVPAKKSKAKAPAKAPAKSKSKGKGSPVGRPMPEGKLGVNEVAALAGVTGRAVRIYCRANDVEKAEGLGRYAWTEKQATALAKKIKAGSK